MNKKILSILLVVMSLSFFSLSCVYVSTRPSNSITEEGTSGGTDGGSNPGDGGTVSGPTVVNADSIANAVKSALGNEIEVGPSLTMSTSDTRVLLSDSSIHITIYDGNLDTKGADESHIITYLNGFSDKMKSAFTSQGLLISDALTFKVNKTSGTSLYINLIASSIKSNPDAEAFTLPGELKDKNSITIELELAAQFQWVTGSSL